MSIVSRHWNGMWVSAPIIYLDDLRKFNKKTMNCDKFFKFVSKSLRYRKLYKKVPETSITRFKFRTTYSFLGSAISRLKADAQSLQNVISGCPVIEDLQVRGGSWMDHVDFSVGNTLKYLSLSWVRFTCQWFEGLISGLPLLERLALEYCRDAINISIHSHSWKSSYYYGSLNNISIQSHSLKVLSIIVLAGFTAGSFSFEGPFRTPNLVCLRLVCGAKSVISFEAPNLLEADLTLRKDKYMHSNDGLVHFLSNLNSIKKMVLCISEKDLIFSESIRSTCAPPLPNLKHLKVKVKDVHNELKKSELMDSLFWCAPSVETLEIEESRDS
ncbi:hypothetical protein FNV43_RR00175 [Rhamnella rubrinervis]|uniref:Uncharacterized protein n=1 Tax=Rhamnella rubrinervis TaxID=2594499 RepID=A0A8K0HNP2_9ROSA|nr:hypothetical protein FNV43_RR00175 [Rhamnella rubrinervis]